MSRNLLEIVMGTLVLVVAGLFVTFAYSVAQLHEVTGYQVTARFNHADGIKTGGDIRISGIKVGTILSETLDPATFQAIVVLSIDKTIKLPEDTVAKVSSSGLLGDKYLQLEPGNSDNNIPPGGLIKMTQSSVSLESLFGQVAFSLSHPTGQASGAAAAPVPTAAPAPAGAKTGP